MGEEGEESNEGSGDGNEAYEEDDTEVRLTMTRNMLTVTTLTFSYVLTHSCSHIQYNTLTLPMNSVGDSLYLLFPTHTLSFSTPSHFTVTRILPPCRNFLSAYKLCVC